MAIEPTKTSHGCAKWTDNHDDNRCTFVITLKDRKIVYTRDEFDPLAVVQRGPRPR
jgi:hypothetical protein